MNETNINISLGAGGVCAAQTSQIRCRAELTLHGTMAWLARALARLLVGLPADDAVHVRILRAGLLGLAQRSGRLAAAMALDVRTTRETANPGGPSE
jgi:hypothetical protein